LQLRPKIWVPNIPEKSQLKSHNTFKIIFWLSTKMLKLQIAKTLAYEQHREFYPRVPLLKVDWIRVSTKFSIIPNRLQAQTELIKCRAIKN